MLLIKDFPAKNHLSIYHSQSKQTPKPPENLTKQQTHPKKPNQLKKTHLGINLPSHRSGTSLPEENRM